MNLTLAQYKKSKRTFILRSVLNKADVLTETANIQYRLQATIHATNTNLSKSLIYNILFYFFSLPFFFLILFFPFLFYRTLLVAGLSAVFRLALSFFRVLSPAPFFALARVLFLKRF